MVVLKLNAIKHPVIVVRDQTLVVQVTAAALLVRDLADRDARTALAMAEVVVALAVNGRAGVGSAAVALADEALAHAEILVSFVASFCETNTS